jgi:formylglycine-generating enzyme required for sulfatase activity
MNPFGLYDMHGSVSEMCIDAYASRYPFFIEDPYVIYEISGSSRIVRGGGLNPSSETIASRSASRTSRTGNQQSNIGFRPVLSKKLGYLNAIDQSGRLIENP